MALEVVIWPSRSIYGLGGQYMALGWPWDDLGGRPRMTSSAHDEKFGRNSLYGL